MLKVLPRRLKVPACPTIALRRPQHRSYAPQQSETPKRHLRKTRVGEVVSNKMEKTIVVAVVRRVPHAKFGKIVKRTKKLYAHDEKKPVCDWRPGECGRDPAPKPLKRWQLVEVLKH